ncbi:hypothetical protein DVU_2279 [Nitratidesulfovibrio vulgaris str. Hildenborough]|uniref:Uncharacterized protein n=1 Tax=Nitratidesulfovibrio vulgaris (strain ATCC 29579 / DSM 644 / CCUG 34227 / NCIMB 8303 / VKM B-1760 / Hildenborough) TaxID=882 RepID=Q729S0_NITV2|nr:hypothetical protein DVU_2279 [Nitratidesulfovibrio vulgaris str. Hildenborough]
MSLLLIVSISVRKKTYYSGRKWASSEVFFVCGGCPHTCRALLGPLSNWCVVSGE